MNLSRPSNRTRDVNRQNIKSDQNPNCSIRAQSIWKKQQRTQWHILMNKTWQKIPSQHQHLLAVRFKQGFGNGLNLWMVGMDFCSAFPAMLAVSWSSILSTSHWKRLDLILVGVPSGAVVCEPTTAASTVHLLMPIASWKSTPLMAQWKHLMMYYCQWPMITCLGGSRELKYRGTVVGKDDCVYGIPDRAKRIVKFDPTNPDTTSTVGGGSWPWGRVLLWEWCIGWWWLHLGYE